MFIQVHDHLRILASQLQVKRVNTFDFVAYSDAASTQDAPVAVNNQKVMRGIYLHGGPIAFQRYMVHTELVSHFLQFAMVISDAD
jgi:hypothetical protein